MIFTLLYFRTHLYYTSSFTAMYRTNTTPHEHLISPYEHFISIRMYHFITRYNTVQDRDKRVMPYYVISVPSAKSRYGTAAAFVLFSVRSKEMISKLPMRIDKFTWCSPARCVKIDDGPFGDH
jgi:hypothetical protein